MDKNSNKNANANNSKNAMNSYEKVVSENNKNVMKYENLLQSKNNYCTYRTINQPRDLYNEKIEEYLFLQDAYVHDTARLDVNPVNGHVGCLGCDHQRPTCPTQSGFAYPEHVGVESKLLGL